MYFPSFFYDFEQHNTLTPQWLTFPLYERLLVETENRSAEGQIMKQKHLANFK